MQGDDQSERQAEKMGNGQTERQAEKMGNGQTERQAEKRTKLISRAAPPAAGSQKFIALKYPF